MASDEGLRALTKRLIVMVAVILGFVALLAPVGTMIENAEGDDPARTTFNLLQGLAHYFSAEAEDFGSVEAHPYAIPLGWALTRIGLVAIGIGGIAMVLIGIRLCDHAMSRRSAWIVTVPSLVVLLGVVSSFFGQVWLPDSDDFAIGPAWGLLSALGVAIWVMHAAWSLHHLDE